MKINEILDFNLHSSVNVRQQIHFQVDKTGNSLPALNRGHFWILRLFNDKTSNKSFSHILVPQDQRFINKLIKKLTREIKQNPTVLSKAQECADFMNKVKVELEKNNETE